VRLLLDTHAFLWWIMGGGLLSRRARAAIGNPANRCAVSISSAWEMAIKLSLGKLKLEAPLGTFLPEQLAANRFVARPIGIRHVARLPFHHRDPFDRLLAAQALEDRLAIVSRDKVFSRYGIRRVC